MKKVASNKLVGHLACLGAYLIFGFNIIVCKNISNSGQITPLTLFSARSIGATILFWLLGLFLPREKVVTKDLFKIFLASMSGLFLTQMCFLKAITMTTPLDTSIMTATTPIFTMFVAAVALKEPITWKKAGGVMLSFCGIVLLILDSVGQGGAVTETKPLGLVLMLLNCFCFALYLGVFRPLIQKYNVVTFMKWMFLFSMLASVPLDMKDLLSVKLSSIGSNLVLNILFVVFFATFVAYFLIPIGQKVLRPTVISLYAYVQPLIASILSIFMGMDVLTWQKFWAAAMVFVGVTFVNRSRSAPMSK
jgi:EamA-like transporter family.